MYNKSHIFKAAWSLFKAKTFETFALCLEASWQAAKAAKEVQEGKIAVFVKKNGQSKTIFPTKEIGFSLTHFKTVVYVNAEGEYRSARIGSFL